MLTDDKTHYKASHWLSRTLPASMGQNTVSNYRRVLELLRMK
ncbi:hypothetical protein VIBNISOn1_820036 [Vibrio nigripulchritudo SOn1]|uniref:Uncharacterized protein n=1 Tax=Vibrio nigripulchritudo SOn1 TaxID=1238450 RepID=A0AAV2VXE5_9VIBR|nr:hypothetical protein VIBNISOn1_820036 [Vibrio nigripulchritudo SOn1]